MCGIAGSVNWDGPDTLQQMIAIQKHRGPDDQGMWHDRTYNGGWVGLGSRRLAILDLSSAGHMPMTNAEQTLSITYNGELYNFVELREELQGKGYRFRSGTDTEVILNLYQEDGPDCLRRLNGMFAFAIWDAREQHLFFARDHFGIKPMYYVHRGARFGFASEAKALLLLSGCEAKVDYAALHQYLTFLWVPDPATLFKGVLKVPAGHYGIFKDGELTLKEFWDLTFPPEKHHFPRGEEDLAEELRHRFSRCVQSQLQSDVPVGAFLSSGLDSSSIVAATAGLTRQPLRTYTISFPKKYRAGESTIDDPEVASATARKFGCYHSEIVVEPDVVGLLPKLIWHLDEPIADPAVIADYIVCHEARKTVTVLLSGVGGDELFAGYRKHVGHYLAQVYRLLPRSIRRNVLEPAIRRLPVMRGSRFKGDIRLLKKMVRNAGLPPMERFLADSTYWFEAEKASLYLPDVRNQLQEQMPWSIHEAHFKRVEGADFLNQMLYVDTKAFMTSLNLTYNDKMSMASSVEVRVPFLDWRFAEWVAWNIPPSLKLRMGRTKHILRKAMAPLLPPEVLKQRKAGFGAPTDYWLANDLREMVDDLLSEHSVRNRGLFSPDTVRNIVAEQRRGEQDWSAQIWQLLTIELWMRTFVDSPVTVPA